MCLTNVYNVLLMNTNIHIIFEWPLGCLKVMGYYRATNSIM